ncbi:MAG: No hits, partial [uncultured Sulfurovum sp.]
MTRRFITIFLLFCISMLHAATVETNKDTYTPNQKITVTFSDLESLNDDWIGIYAEGSENTWANMIQWDWTDDIAAGTVTFNALPAGDYEIRAYYNNSFVLEASKKFTVEPNLVAATVTTDKETYLLNELVTTSFANMAGNANDWIGIYPAGSTTAWQNMVKWEWIAAEINGTQTFQGLPVGDYEARVFFNNSLIMEASQPFSVTANNVVATIETTKDTYSHDEQIVTVFDDMSGNEEDWIAIYPAGSVSNWANVIQWEWANSNVSGSQTFEALPEGDYEVRAFFNNSYNIEASHAFSVENTEVVLTSHKEVYDPQELIHVDFDKMRGTGSDWIGVFTAGSGHEHEDAIQWKYAQSSVSGTLNFDGLLPGNYEIRAYFATSYRKTINFTVQDVEATTIHYENAENPENGFQQEWFHNGTPVSLINVGAEGSAHSVRAQRGDFSYFSFNNPDKKLRYLVLDTRIGTASHVGNFGVKLKTANGNRRIIFSSYMNHMTNGRNDFSGNAVPTDPMTLDGYLHNHPGPTDYYLDTKDGSFVHYKINIEEKLRILEPDNELLGITLFTSAGGDFDNISL